MHSNNSTVQSETKKTSAEKELYAPVLQRLRESFNSVGVEIHLEISAAKGAGEIFKRAILRGQEIIFSFLTKRPDILGHTINVNMQKFLMVEVKAAKLKLDDIYQAKKYKELIGASGAFLVSPEPIPEELMRLCDARQSILHSSDDYEAFLVLAQFDLKRPSLHRMVSRESV